jgi:2-polyprenyl-6-methoxyphenol hydroxylase-like FAD-dependent oxidoreductase
MGHVKTVLISGASIAGTAAAYWLGQHGYAVTVVERHPELRPGGQAIDVRGPALTVLDRMGLLAAAEEKKTRIRGSSVVDRDGNELSRDTESTPTGGPIDNPDIELLRDDLLDLLYGTTRETTEYLFDDSIVALENLGPEVNVTFERAPAGSFDLVIGADGLHSNVRTLVFGPEERFIKRLGTHAAIFTVPNFLDLDFWQTWHYGDASMAGVYSARNNTEARAMLGFMDTELRIDFRDTEAQFAEVERRMGDDGWVRPQLLQYMRSAPDFYFDEMSQIVMDHWSIGRVALVGDAAYCCSPLSGQGTSVALLGAYILAGELKLASQAGLVDHGLAFTNYFKRFQAYTKRTQFLATDNIPGGAPISQEQFEAIINSITLLNY